MPGDTSPDLRARVLEALVTAPAGFVRDDPESAADHASRPWRRHDQHKYDGGCALCRGEADTLADAVMAVLGQALAGDEQHAESTEWGRAETQWGSGYRENDGPGRWFGSLGDEASARAHAGMQDAAPECRSVVLRREVTAWRED